MPLATNARGGQEDLLEKLRTPGLCTRELAENVRCALFPETDAVAARPCTMRAGERGCSENKPSRRRAEKHVAAGRGDGAAARHARVVGPFAMRVINQNVATLASLIDTAKADGQDREKPGRLRRNEDYDACNCLVDTAFYAVDALAALQTHLNLEPLQLEMAVSNIITTLIDLKFYNRALEELCTLQSRLCGVRKLASDQSGKNVGAGFLSGKPVPRPRVLRSRTNQPHETAARYVAASKKKRQLRESSPGAQLPSAAQPTKSQEEIIHSHHPSLFKWRRPIIDDSGTQTNLLMLLIALNLSAARCWIEIGDLALLNHLSVAVGPSSSTSEYLSLWDCCELLSRCDPEAASKQFDLAFRLLYRASTTANTHPRVAIKVRACSLEFLSQIRSTCATKLCDYARKFLLAFHLAADGEGDSRASFSLAQAYCRRVLKIVRRHHLSRDPGDVKGAVVWQDVAKKDSMFVKFCDVWATLARKAGDNAAAMEPYRILSEKWSDDTSGAGCDCAEELGDLHAEGVCGITPGDEDMSLKKEESLYSAGISVCAAVNVAILALTPNEHDSENPLGSHERRSGSEKDLPHAIRQMRGLIYALQNFGPADLRVTLDAMPEEAALTFLRLVKACGELRRVLTARRKLALKRASDGTVGSGSKTRIASDNSPQSSNSLTRGHAGAAEGQGTMNAERRPPAVIATAGGRGRKFLANVKNFQTQMTTVQTRANEFSFLESNEALAVMADMCSKLFESAASPGSAPRLAERAGFVAVECIHQLSSSELQSATKELEEMSAAGNSSSAAFLSYFQETLRLSKLSHAPAELARLVAAESYNVAVQLYNSRRYQDAAAAVGLSRDVVESMLTRTGDEALKAEFGALLVKRFDLLGVCWTSVADHERAMCHFREALLNIQWKKVFDAHEAAGWPEGFIPPAAATPEAIMNRYLRTAVQKLKMQTQSSDRPCKPEILSMSTTIAGCFGDSEECTVGMVVEMELRALREYAVSLSLKDARGEVGLFLASWRADVLRYGLDFAYKNAMRFPIRRARLLIETASFARSSSASVVNTLPEDLCAEAIDLLKQEDLAMDEPLARFRPYLAGVAYGWLAVCLHDATQRCHLSTAAAPAEKRPAKTNNAPADCSHSHRKASLLPHEANNRDAGVEGADSPPTGSPVTVLDEGRGTNAIILRGKDQGAEYMDRIVSASKLAFQFWRKVLSAVQPFGTEKANPKQLADVRQTVDDVDRFHALLCLLRDLFNLYGVFPFVIIISKLRLRLLNGIWDPPEGRMPEIAGALTNLGEAYLRLGYTGKAGLAFAKTRVLFDSNELPASESRRSKARVMCGLAYCSYLAALRNTQKSFRILEETRGVYCSWAESPSSLAKEQAPRGTLKRTLLANAHMVQSEIVFRDGRLHDAIQDAFRAFMIMSKTLARAMPKARDGLPKAFISADDADDPFVVKSNAENGTETSVESKSPICNLQVCEWHLATIMLDCLHFLARLYTVRGSVREAEYFHELGALLASQTGSLHARRKMLLSLSEFEYHAMAWEMSEAHAREAIVAHDCKDASSAWLTKDNAVARMRIGDVAIQNDGLDAALRRYREGDEVLSRIMNEEFIEKLGRLKITETTPRISKIMSLSIPQTPKIPAKVTVGLECNPLADLQTAVRCRLGWVLGKQGKLKEGENIVGRCRTDDPVIKVEHHLALTNMSLLALPKKLSRSAVFRSLLDSVLFLPIARPRAKRPATEKAQADHAVSRKLTTSVDHLLEVYHDAHETAVPPVFQDVCMKLVFATTVGAASSVIPPSSAEESVYYLGMAVGVTLRREMVLRTMEAKLANDVLVAAWPTPPEQSKPASKSVDQNHMQRIYSQESELTVEEFREKFVDILPANWTVCSLALDADRQGLYVSRMRKGAPAVLVRLPFKRRSALEGEHAAYLSYEDALNQFAELLRRSDESTKRGSTLTTKEQKAAWWKERRTLDENLRELLESIEETWLGAFRGFLVPHSSEVGNEDALRRLKQRIESLLFKAVVRNRIVGSFKQLEIDPEIIRCLIRLGGEMWEEDLLDVLHYFVDTYQYAGYPVDRTELDIKLLAYDLKGLLQHYHKSFVSCAKDAGSAVPHLLLVLDKHLQALPWESLPTLRRLPITRLPSLSLVRDRLLAARGRTPDSGRQRRTVQIEDAEVVRIDAKKGYYILNPAGDLLNTQQAFERFLESFETWDGITGRAPTEGEYLRALSANDLFLYFGHGGGEQYARGQAVRQLNRCSVALLMGCSSGHLTHPGNFDPHGTVLNYMMAGSHAVVGNLWDVTDKDTDRFTAGMLRQWGVRPDGVLPEGNAPSSSLAEAVMKSRDECTLKYLIGASPVVYGVPVYISRAT